MVGKTMDLYGLGSLKSKVMVDLRVENRSNPPALQAKILQSPSCKLPVGQVPVLRLPSIRSSASSIALRFLQNRLGAIVVVSAVLVIPCYWHSRIQAGDLGSHSYNAWLAHLIHRGQATGLYFASQWNNVVVDWALDGLGNWVGYGAAEKIVASAAALIFSWGAFAFIAAATGRAPWDLLPAIAMVTYGWTFQMGFMNYYVSIGLAFLILALIWRGGGWDYAIAAAMVPFVFFAHPIGFLWLIGATIYCKLSDRLTGRFRWMLLPMGFCAVAGVHFYISHQYRAFDPIRLRAVLFTGWDQLVLYSHVYRILGVVIFLAGSAIFVAGALAEWKTPEFWQRVRTPLELWIIAVFGAAMLWEGLSVPKYGMGVTFLPERVTSITAVLGLCVLGCVRLRRWQVAALAGCAAAFFALLYRDTAVLNRMENETVLLVRQLPPKTRVIETISPLPGSRVGAVHVLDRACIERCYAYSNYEPSTRQFRIRVNPGSTVVVADAASGLAMREGRYAAKPGDLPMFQVYQCDKSDLTKLCLRDLAAGQGTREASSQP